MNKTQALKDKFRQSAVADDAAVDARYRLADSLLGKTRGESDVVTATFTMPPQDVERIDRLRTRIGKLGHTASKSEIVRAGLAVLEGIDDAVLSEVLNTLTKVALGRKKRFG